MDATVESEELRGSCCTSKPLLPKYRLLPGSVKRHCLERGDEEGEKCDLNPVQQPLPDASPLSTAGVEAGPASAATADVVQATTGLTVAAPDVECEAELESICAEMEAILAPIWANNAERVSEKSSFLGGGCSKRRHVTVRVRWKPTQGGCNIPM